MKILSFLLLTLFFATIGFAEVSQQSDETNKKIEKIEEKLDTTKEELTKYTQITEDTKERVGDISGSVDRFGILVTFFGVLITVIVIIVSIRSAREAKQEAKDEAYRLLKDWIEKEAKSKFEAKVNDLSNELQAKGDEILKRIEEKANEQHDKREEDYKNWKLNLNPTQEEKDDVEKEVKMIEGKREEDLTFKDYSLKIINQFNQKNYKEALRLIDQAIELVRENSENSEKIARLYLAKGLTFGITGKFNQAIKIYNEIITLYQDSEIDSIKEQVINAIIHKIELEITLDKPISDYMALIQKLNPQINDMAIFEMLWLLQNSKISLQHMELSSWLVKYQDVKYQKWGFRELENWIEKATYSEDVKARIQGYIEIFKTHLHRA